MRIVRNRTYRRLAQDSRLLKVRINEDLTDTSDKDLIELRLKHLNFILKCDVEWAKRELKKAEAKRRS